MTATAGAPGALTLDGVASTVGGRHAFVRERVLALVARETERSGGLAPPSAILPSSWAATSAPLTAP